ncbi:MAG: hypothetical protein K8I82_12175 [Anaerolineae bacterium]|nr:hypothetical protein [Anaerolineae bacterium]
MTEQVVISLQEFVRQSPEQIQDFIKQSWSQENLNWWLGVAEYATLNTFQHPGKVHLEWARVAIMVYERLAMDSPGKSVDLMGFKAHLIQSLGSVQPIPLATVDEIVQWFSILYPIPMKKPCKS